MTDQEIRAIIENSITSTWLTEIQADYQNRWLLKEDTLKNALYFHLRGKLGNLLEAHDIRIYTEFTDCEFKHSGYRPDMVIARVDPEKDVAYWGDAVTECLAVIELKYKSGYTASQDIYEDFSKLRTYIEKLPIDCRLFMATIWEYEDDETSWMESDCDWAIGKVTELNASFKKTDGTPQFYIIEH